MGPKKRWFLKGDMAVEVREAQITKDGRTNVYHPLAAAEVITAIEDHLLTGRGAKGEDGDVMFVRRSMSREIATALLASPQFKRQLPRIDRILDVPVPYLQERVLLFANTGYDERLNTFCPAVHLGITPLGLEKSKELLRELFQDFCFANRDSATIAIARLITPMCRGLMGWSARPPVFIFEGNRPRAGKDYLAGCTSVLYEGYANEDAPLDSEREETIKRIGAALSSGRRFMHFANCKGHIDNAGFEQASTAKVFNCRKLGSNESSADLKLPNETEFSLSANTGFSFSEDFNLRCRKISLAYSEEDANGRRFSHTDLHGWILDHRQELLNAVAGLIQYWHQQGCPPGETVFTSFPEWARVVGGILVTCELGDPCVPQLDGTMTTDTTTAEMKKLFQFAIQEKPNEWLRKHEVYQLVSGPEGNLFEWLDLNERSGQSIFGKKLREFTGRALGGIYLQIDTHDNRRARYRFTQERPPIRENMAAAVLGIPETQGNQESKCQPCQPCQPVSPLHVFQNPIPAVSVIRGGPEMVDMVDMVDISVVAKPVSLPTEEAKGNLKFDEDGCPIRPNWLNGHEPSIQPIPMPVLDLSKKLEQTLDSIPLVDHSPVPQLNVENAVTHPDLKTCEGGANLTRCDHNAISYEWGSAASHCLSLDHRTKDVMKPKTTTTLKNPECVIHHAPDQASLQPPLPDTTDWPHPKPVQHPAKAVNDGKCYITVKSPPPTELVNTDNQMTEFHDPKDFWNIDLPEMLLRLGQKVILGNQCDEWLSIKEVSSLCRRYHLQWRGAGKKAGHLEECCLEYMDKHGDIKGIGVKVEYKTEFNEDKRRGDPFLKFRRLYPDGCCH